MVPGGANNPTGRNQYTEDEEVNHDHVMNDKFDGEPATQGSSSEYVLRRLTRAAKGQKSHGVEVKPRNTRNDQDELHHNNTPGILRRLARDRPDLHERVVRGDAIILASI